MKKLLLILLGLGILFHTACDPEDEGDSQEPTIIGTWVAKESTSLLYNETTMDTLSYFSVPLQGPNVRQLAFAADGSVTITDEGNSNTHTYTYVNDQLTIEMNGVLEVYDVPVLSNSSLVLLQGETTTSNGQTLYEEERLRYAK